jgi:hypothetical protein
VTFRKPELAAPGDALSDEEVQAIINLLYALYNAESVCVDNAMLGFASMFGGISGLVSELLVTVVTANTPASRAAADALEELIASDKALEQRKAKSKLKSKLKVAK